MDTLEEEESGLSECSSSDDDADSREETDSKEDTDVGLGTSRGKKRDELPFLGEVGAAFGGDQEPSDGADSKFLEHLKKRDFEERETHPKDATEDLQNVEQPLLPVPTLFAESVVPQQDKGQQPENGSPYATVQPHPAPVGVELHASGEGRWSDAEASETGGWSSDTVKRVPTSKPVQREDILPGAASSSPPPPIRVKTASTTTVVQETTVVRKMETVGVQVSSQVILESRDLGPKMPESGSDTEKPLHRNSSFPEPPPLPPQGAPPTPPLPPPPPPAPLATSETDSQSTGDQKAHREGDGTLRKGSCDGRIPTPYQSNKSPASTLRRHQPRRKGDAVHTLSNLYTKLLLSSTFILLLTELLPNQLPLFFFHSYLYAYILGGAVVFLTSIFISVIMSKCPEFSGPPGDDIESSYGGKRRTGKSASIVSIYLRLGSIVFALGTLAATSLEVATLFTMPEPCLSDLSLSLPVMQIVFTFLQMSFLIMNGQKVLGSMGWFRHISLMHLTATNVAVWLKMVLWETTYEWLTSEHITPTQEKLWPPAGYNTSVHVLETSGEHKVYYSTNCRWKTHQGEKTEDLIALHQCLYNNTVGSIWKKSVPFISPFVLQYSLLAAFITYSLWVCLQTPSRTRKRVIASSTNSLDVGSSNEDEPARSSACYLSGWSVDCQGSSKGFFLGILVLAAGIIALILHFVLTNDQNLRSVTLLALVSTHAVIQGISSLASMLGLCQIQDLKIRVSRPRYSDEVIQSVGILAAFVYGCFAMVAAVLDLNDTYHLVVFVDGGLLLLQSIVQSLLIRQVAQRSSSGDPDSRRSRSGRQVVTFLIFTNVVLWLIETFTTHDHVTSQLQLEFFGTITWGVVGRVVFPMVMLFRFHSAMALLDGWKRAYKTRPRP